MSELAESLRDLDEVKKNRNELNKENKDLREKIENAEKERESRMRMLQRSVGHSHSRDSAIDTDLQVSNCNKIFMRKEEKNSYILLFFFSKYFIVNKS